MTKDIINYKVINNKLINKTNNKLINPKGEWATEIDQYN